MRRDTTSGLASAYQLVYGTARSELGINVLDTSDFSSVPVSVIEEESELGKLLEREVVSIRIPPYHEGLATHLLSKVSQFQSLADHIYMLPRSDLRLLDEMGIPYEKIG